MNKSQLDEEIKGVKISDQTKYNGPNERTDQNARKRPKQNEDSQPIRRRVQNTEDEDDQRSH